ncbi:hypothetical protein BJX62DRAFT_210413 [Aspergillus germanicus]
MGGSQSTVIKPAFSFRVATKADLDELARVHIEGFTEEPQVHYCYPLRHEYPEDHWKWTRREYEDFLAQPQKYLVHVLEATAAANGRRSTTRTIAGHAVWNLEPLTAAIDPDPQEKERKDANKKHCDAFKAASGKRFHTYFAEWAEKQVNLSSLVVHPDFRRGGGGTMLVNWGIETAREKLWPVTLCASPMGRLLYTHLNFEEIASEIVQVEGEEETLVSTVMIYPAKKHS